MKLVLVEWIDSHSGEKWLPLDQARERCGPLHCRSVGWLAEDARGYIMLVPHLSGEKNGDVRVCGTGDLSIPKKAVTKMTVLKR